MRITCRQRRRVRTASNYALIVSASCNSAIKIIKRRPVIRASSHARIRGLRIGVTHTVSTTKLNPTSVNYVIININPTPFAKLETKLIATGTLTFTAKTQLVNRGVLSPRSTVLHTTLHNSTIVTSTTKFLTSISRATRGNRTSKELRPRRRVALYIGSTHHGRLCFSLGRRTNIANSRASSYR